MYILQHKLHVYAHNLNVYLVLPLPFAGIYHSQISKILLTEYCKVQTLKRVFLLLRIQESIHFILSSADGCNGYSPTIRMLYVRKQLYCSIVYVATRNKPKAYRPPLVLFLRLIFRSSLFVIRIRISISQMRILCAFSFVIEFCTLIHNKVAGKWVQ